RAAVAALSIMEPRDRTMVDAVRGALNDKDERVRLQAVRGMGVFILTDSKNQAAAVEAIGRVMANDANEEVRTVAVGIAKKLTDGEYQKKLVPPLAEVMRQDKNVTLRAEAASVLGRMGSNAKAVVNVIVDSLKDQEPTVRAAAAEALGRIGEEAKGSIP